MVSDHFAKGGAGAVELATVVQAVCETERAKGASGFRFLYELAGTTIKQKIESIAMEIYGADGVPTPHPLDPPHFEHGSARPAKHCVYMSSWTCHHPSPPLTAGRALQAVTTPRRPRSKSRTMPDSDTYEADNLAQPCPLWGPPARVAAPASASGE